MNFEESRMIDKSKSNSKDEKMNDVANDEKSKAKRQRGRARGRGRGKGRGKSTATATTRGRSRGRQTGRGKGRGRARGRGKVKIPTTISLFSNDRETEDEDSSYDESCSSSEETAEIKFDKLRKKYNVDDKFMKIIDILKIPKSAGDEIGRKTADLIWKC